MFSSWRVSFDDKLTLTRVAAVVPAQITHRETMADITEQTGAAVVTRGIFIAPGQKVPEGERKLGLLIQVCTAVAAALLWHVWNLSLAQRSSAHVCDPACRDATLASLIVNECCRNVQGPTESSVKAAKAEIKRILEDSTERAMRREAGAGGVAPGRYSIV